MQRFLANRVEPHTTLPALAVTDWMAVGATKLSTFPKVTKSGISPMLNCRTSFRTAYPEPACRRFIALVRSRPAPWSVTCGHCREKLRRQLYPAMQYAGRRFSLAKASAQVATRSPGKAVFLDPICLVKEQAPRARRFGRRSSGRRDYRPRATGRLCSLQVPVIGKRA